LHIKLRNDCTHCSPCSTLNQPHPRYYLRRPLSRSSVATMKGLALFLSLVLLTSAARGADTYDIIRDFSATENPSGAWSYGWKENLRGEFYALQFNRTQFDESGTSWHIWEYRTYGVQPAFIYFPLTNTATVSSDGGVGRYPPGTLVITTGHESTRLNFAVLRFTAQKSGVYRVTASVRSHLDGPPSGDTDFHVLLNGHPVFQRFLDPVSQTSFSRLIHLLAGDTVDFAMGRGRDGVEFGSALKIKAVINRRARSEFPWVHFRPVP
jgi:hypothetical protein